MLPETLTAVGELDPKVILVLTKVPLTSEQILSNEMKQFYENEENGREQFVDFFSSNRRELAKTLQRMHGGKGFGEVTSVQQGNVIMYSFIPRVARSYTFKSVSFMRENEFLKLHSIR